MSINVGRYYKPTVFYNKFRDNINNLSITSDLTKEEILKLSQEELLTFLNNEFIRVNPFIIIVYGAEVFIGHEIYNVNVDLNDIDNINKKFKEYGFD